MMVFFWFLDFLCQFFVLVVEPVKIASLIKNPEKFAQNLELTTKIIF